MLNLSTPIWINAHLSWQCEMFRWKLVNWCVAPVHQIFFFRDIIPNSARKKKKTHTVYLICILYFSLSKRPFLDQPTTCSIHSKLIFFHQKVTLQKIQEPTMTLPPHIQQSIHCLHPGRLTNMEPTNHPFLFKGKWSEPNLHDYLVGGFNPFEKY